MLETSLETKLRLLVQKMGGFCIKLNPQWNIGIPDRVIILPKRVIFVELKRPGSRRLSTTQKFWRDRLQLLGCEYWLCNSEQRIEEMLMPTRV